MGNSPADLVTTAGYSTKMLLEIYAKPTGKLKTSPTKKMTSGHFKTKPAPQTKPLSEHLSALRDGYG